MWALALGVVAGALCALAIDLKFAFGFDDSLDVVGIHLVGGITGTLWIGLFGNGVGAAFGFGFHQLAMQALGALAVLVYSFIMAYAIGWVVDKLIGFRVQVDAEIAGIDTVVHGEEAYAFGVDRL